ncbi:MAG: dTDP-4-dehydrorhamnose 3,5-epimerase family protein [Chloroflexi bacterium]|nr:dTDP-4-dehydrorhamnose 3,5-epimerase family protein [Chloroflexota bacterium]
MIQGVEVKRLTRHADERGYLMEILRSDDEIFSKFGQCYVSMNYPNVIRAWHWHQKQDDHFVVVKGMIRVGLYDMRESSPTRGEVNEFYLGENNNIVLKIPVGVAHGYKTVGVEPSLLVNFPSEVYNREEPDEQRLPWDTDQIPFNWEIEFK